VTMAVRHSRDVEENGHSAVQVLERTVIDKLMHQAVSSVKSVNN